MNSISFALAVIIIFGYIFHSTMHPEDVITGSHSEHFAPSLWLYFIPAQAAHFPYNIFSPLFSAFVESSIVIALVSGGVVAILGSQVEKTICISSSSSNNNNNAFYIASLSFFGKVFVLSHGTFLAVSFLTSAMSTALVKSTHPHPDKEKHEQEETMKIGYAYFGPLAFACGVSVVAWCRNSINNLPGEEESLLSAAFSSSSSSSSNNTTAAGVLLQTRFVPFYLVSLALVRDIFFGDHPPTHSEFMLGIATRGPLFLGVLAGMWVTWFYFRFVESRTEFVSASNNNNNSNNNNGDDGVRAAAAAANATPSLVTYYGNSSGRFALHRGFPTSVLSERIILPVSTFFFSKLLRTVTSYGNQIDAKWVEFVELEKQHSSITNQNSNNNTNSSSSTMITTRSRRNSIRSENSIFANAVPPEGTTIVNIADSNNNHNHNNSNNSVHIVNPEAARRRELAMAALMERMKKDSSDNGSDE